MAQHSCVAVHVDMPHATGRAAGVTVPASALPVVPPLLLVPLPVVPPLPVPVVVPEPDVPDALVPPDVAVVPLDVPVPVALLEPPSNEPSSRMPPPQPARGATRTPNEREARPNSDEKRADTFMAR